MFSPSLSPTGASAGSGLWNVLSGRFGLKTSSTATDDVPPGEDAPARKARSCASTRATSAFARATLKFLRSCRRRAVTSSAERAERESERVPGRSTPVSPAPRARHAHTPLYCLKYALLPPSNSRSLLFHQLGSLRLKLPLPKLPLVQRTLMLRSSRTQTLPVHGSQTPTHIGFSSCDGVSDRKAEQRAASREGTGFGGGFLSIEGGTRGSECLYCSLSAARWL